MSELKLYPTKANLQKGMALGAGAMALAIYLFNLDGEIEFQLLAAISLFGGFWMILRAGFRLYRPRPVFEADRAGFSVKGKKKRPWTEFRNVDVYRRRSGIISWSKSIRVKVGKSFLGGNLEIGALELSGPADVMREEIAAFAREMSIAPGESYTVPPLGVAIEALGTRRAKRDRPTAKAIVQPSAPKSGVDQDAGPIRTSRSWIDRILGRGKAR